MAQKKRGKNRIIAVVIVFVLLIVFFGFLFLPKIHAPVALTPSQVEQMVGTATVSIPDMNTQVSLSHGQAQFPSEGATGTVQIMGPYTSVITPKGHDIFAVMVYNLGGSGEFVAVTLFHEKDNAITYKGSYFIGDRVPITNIIAPSETKTGTYEVTIEYKDRTEDESMVDTPTVQKEAKIQIQNHQIITPQE